MSTKVPKSEIADQPVGLRLRYRFGTTSAIALVMVAAVVATGLNLHVLEVLETEAEVIEPTVAPSESEKIDPETLEMPVQIDDLPLSFEFMTAPGSSVDQVRQNPEPLSGLDLPGQSEQTEDIQLAEVAPGHGDADYDDEPVAQTGKELEGLELARLTVMKANEPRVLAGWLRAEMAVLEIYTNRGLFVGVGTPDMDLNGFRALRFTRASDLGEDIRSDLRISSLAPAALPLGVIRAQLSETSGIYEIERVELVFTHEAAVRIFQAQAGSLAKLHERGIDAAANELNLVICIENKDVSVEAVRALSDNRLLIAPSRCGD
jgi:hypothetical protein